MTGRDKSCDRVPMICAPCYFPLLVAWASTVRHFQTGMTVLIPNLRLFVPLKAALCLQ